MNRDGPLRDGVRVVDHDPARAEVFEEISDRLRAALGSTAVRIEHVGSTAAKSAFIEEVLRDLC